MLMVRPHHIRVVLEVGTNVTSAWVYIGLQTIDVLFCL